ncbi:COMPASS (complex proteins associated with Set1p) component [Ophidiomyces ophidiicola]|nr:COMPASS (complex proteins associated with Set1p) component [Ophidiomyces ophidiicola]KAI2004763.1 COMPASS (complex proteins associated with Set1p) component [Ophidiomyces ophidiicola]KAI2053996.1 COMPASS (complex proteins associated with Set1p) component [Ophidiomyces ophidiicola]KAI2066855.1 COMPASS (complex proteins associated with Set1p) component [Ophidiomyces ophidiicola]KAI2076705.1 COMPASS (complex proteins associated with Set1p) component [Ophidiomyces ophidiicola]
MDGESHAAPLTMQNNTPSDQRPNSASPSNFASAPSASAPSQDTAFPSHPGPTTQVDRDIIMGGSMNRQNNAITDASSMASSSTPLASVGGAPARIYLNEKIVPYLLEGMKPLAKDQ